MQINKTQFKPFTEQEKQHRHVNNLSLYCGKLGHIVGACPNKHVQCATHSITSTNTQGLEKKGTRMSSFNKETRP
jgi:phosphopantothenoylcysteine synthetase/decarboxylase